MSVPAKLWKHQFAWKHFSRVNFPLIWGKHWNPRRVSSRIHFSHQKVENVCSAVTSWWSQGTGCGPPCPPSRLMHWRADPCWGSWAQHSWGGLLLSGASQVLQALLAQLRDGCNSLLHGRIWARSPWGVEGASVVSRKVTAAAQVKAQA